MLQVCCKAVNIRKPGNNSKAMALWMLRDAKTIGEVHHDWSRERHIVSRATVRQALWDAHVQNPTAALKEALIRTETGADRALSSTARRSETRAAIV